MTGPPGQVFTPTVIADAMWRLALTALGDPKTLSAIDPAAGAGALVEAGLRSNAEVDLSAVELDPALVATLRDVYPSVHVVHADALTLGQGPDAPASRLGEQYGALAPAQLRTGDDRLLRSGWADAVIANPPYLRETGHRDLFRALRSWHAGALAGLYRKDADLHHVFWDLKTRPI